MVCAASHLAGSKVTFELFLLSNLQQRCSKRSQNNISIDRFERFSFWHDSCDSYVEAPWLYCVAIGGRKRLSPNGMKMKITFSMIIVAAIIVGLLPPESKAQESWGSRYSPSCRELGECHYGNDSVELIRYGRGTGFQFGHTPYQAGYVYIPSGYDQVGGCEYGGTCNHGLNPQQAHRDYSVHSYGFPRGRCRYEQNRLDGHQDLYQSTGPSPNAGYGANNFSRADYYAVPFQPQPDTFQQRPADESPQLGSPSFPPQTNPEPNYSRSDSNGLQSVPPTSRQIIPPPQLPPQPPADSKNAELQQNNNQSIKPLTTPQLLPPTNLPKARRQLPASDTADPNHAGHDHFGHNHDH